MAAPTSITNPVCGASTFNANDVAQGCYGTRHACASTGRIPDDTNLRRNQKHLRIAPGFWEDIQGNPHISERELLAMVGLPSTPENCAAAMKSLNEMFRQQNPNATLINREKPN